MDVKQCRNTDTYNLTTYLKIDFIYEMVFPFLLLKYKINGKWIMKLSCKINLNLNLNPKLTPKTQHIVFILLIFILFICYFFIVCIL